MKKAMIRKLFFAATALLLAAMLVACSSKVPVAQPSSQAAPAQSQPSVGNPSPSRGGNPKGATNAAAGETYEVVNLTYTHLWELYISDVESNDWGKDLLPSDGLAYEEWLYFETDASYVDVYFCDENDVDHVVYDVYLEAGSIIEIVVGQFCYGVYITYEDGTGDYYAEEGSNIPDNSNQNLPEPAGPIFFEIFNELGSGDVDYLFAFHIAPAGSSDSGPDVLGSTTLDGGSWITASVDGPGYYHLEILDGPGATWYFDDVYLESDCEVYCYLGSQFELYVEVEYSGGGYSTHYPSGMSA